MVTRSNLSSSTNPRGAGGATIIGAKMRNGDGPGPQVMDAATLIGDPVVNGADEDLGKIEAIMLDVSAGRIAYAVLSFGGFLGMGNKLFAIPWSALTLDAEDKCFILNVEKDVLEGAPGFDKDHWPSMADSTWATEIHSYYSATPYWDDPLRSPRGTRASGADNIKDPNAS